MSPLIFIIVSIFVLVGMYICILILQKQMIQNDKLREPFVPVIQKIYQPHIRKTRLFIERTGDKWKKYFSHYSKKRGII